MAKKTKKQLEEELKKELEEKKAELALLSQKNNTKKKVAKAVKSKKKEAKKEVAKAVKSKKKEAKKEVAKAVKSKKKEAKKEVAKAVKSKKKEAKKKITKIEEPEIPKTLEEEFEDQYSDEELRNFSIEKKDMEQLTNKVCEIVAAYGDDGMLQSELWKKLKLSTRDGSRLSLRLERRGMITREKILQNGRWTYKLIIEHIPISLDSIQDAPCLTCPVEQKCNVDNVYPEPSPNHCELIEEWVVAEFKRKK